MGELSRFASEIVTAPAFLPGTIISRAGLFPSSPMVVMFLGTEVNEKIGNWPPINS